MREISCLIVDLGSTGKGTTSVVPLLYVAHVENVCSMLHFPVAGGGDLYLLRCRNVTAVHPKSKTTQNRFAPSSIAEMILIGAD